MMVRSIRGRLVVGTMLLSLFSVGMVGVVALLLMQRYLVQQERAYLTANAEAIARQAVMFMTPVHAAPPLQQLAQTSAFLGDASVRIVDDSQALLADSGATLAYSTTNSMAAAPVYFQIAAPALSATYEITPAVAPPVVWMLDEHNVTMRMSDPFAAAIAPGVADHEAGAMHTSNVIVVQRSPSIWGDRLSFKAQVGHGGVAHAEVMPVAVTATMDVPLESVARPQPGRALPAAPVAAETVPMVKPSFLQVAGFQPTELVSAPIRIDGATIGFVEVQRATGLVDEPLGAIRRALAIAAGASSLLALAAGLVMSHTLTAPIQTLAQTAAAMSSGDLTARAPVVGRDELAALARQFNQMADALHHSFAELAAERDTLRRFVADASHELRTPITALRTFNELLQGAAREDPCAQAEFLAESQSQIARLEWITRNLLDLSRWEGGMATLTLTPVELGEVVNATATPFRALAHERGIELTVVLPESPVVATVDEQRLALVVANLLDNALKFTHAGGQVEVGLQADIDQVAVWVADTGVGIDMDDLPHIFDRFYRSPRATQAGSGLGLAIVEHIVNAHGAQIDVASQVGVGSRFTLRLPGAA